MQPQQFVNTQIPSGMTQSQNFPNQYQNYLQQPPNHSFQHQYFNSQLASSNNSKPQIFSNQTNSNQMISQQPLIVNMTQAQQRTMIAPQVINQVTTSPQKQQQYEVHHVERPLEVITIDEIESPWRLKCSTLERQILELQIQLRKGGLPQIQTIEVVDDSKIKSFEKKINELKNIASDREAELEELNQRIRELIQQIEESSTTKTSFLTSEVNTWKQKFTELNREFNETEEQLVLTTAELDSIQRQGGGASHTTHTTVKETKKQSKQY